MPQRQALPGIVPLAPGALDRARQLDRSSERVVGFDGLPRPRREDGPFDAVRHIPLPTADGLVDAVAAFPQPRAEWQDLTNAMDVTNLGRSSAEIGVDDLAFDRQVPVLATPGVRTFEGRVPRSIRDLEIRSTGGGNAGVAGDPTQAYRGESLDRPRKVSRVHAVCLPLLDIVRALQVRRPNMNPAFVYPEFFVPGVVGQDQRVLTTLGPNQRGLRAQTQLDVSVTLSIAEAGPNRSAFLVPPLALGRPRSLGVDGVFCAVARIDPRNLRAFPLRVDENAPAWGMIAGDFERVIGPGLGRRSTFSQGGMTFTPFGATLRTLRPIGRNGVTGLGDGDDPVSVLDGLDLANFNFPFPPEARPDENREIAERYLSRLLEPGRGQRFYPQRRVRFTLSMVTLPENLDRWVGADGLAGVPDVAKASLVVQVSALWLETDRQYDPGAGAADAPARWRGVVMRTPAYLDMRVERDVPGWAHVEVLSPGRDLATRLIGTEFDFGVVLGAFSALNDSPWGVRVRVDDVQARFSAIPVTGQRDQMWIRTGIPDASVNGSISQVFAMNFPREANPEDAR
jgi:hypothetical protein